MLKKILHLLLSARGCVLIAGELISEDEFSPGHGCCAKARSNEGSDREYLKVLSPSRIGCHYPRVFLAGMAGGIKRGALSSRGAVGLRGVVGGPFKDVVSLSGGKSSLGRARLGVTSRCGPAALNHDAHV